MSPHAWLIAVVFVPYMLMMAGLFAYIARTGRPRGQDQDEGGGERDPGPAARPLAA